MCKFIYGLLNPDCLVCSNTRDQCHLASAAVPAHRRETPQAEIQKTHHMFLKNILIDALLCSFLEVVLLAWL